MHMECRMIDPEQQPLVSGDSLQRYVEPDKERRDEDAISAFPEEGRIDRSLSSIGSDLSSLRDTKETPYWLGFFERTGRALCCFFPKIQLLSWSTFFVLAFLSAIPAALYITLFSKIGFGVSTMYYLSKNVGRYTDVMLFTLAATFLSLYLLDFETWTSRIGKTSRVLGICAVIIGTVAVVLSLSDDHPYGPMCLFVVATPGWMVAVKFLFYRAINPRAYVSWLSGPLVSVSFVTCITWAMWAFSCDQNEWDKTMRLRDAETAGCEPDLESHPACRKEGRDEVCFTIGESSHSIEFPDGCRHDCVEVYDACINTFILWLSPLLVGISFLFLGFICTFLRSDSDEKDLLNFARLWLLVLFAIWVAASLAEAGDGIILALAAFSLAVFAGSGVLLSICYNMLSETERGSAVLARLSEKYSSYMDVAKGLLIVTCAPVALLYLALSFINQSVRRARLFLCSTCPTDGQGNNAHRGLLTEKASRQVREFQKWDRAKVYTNAVYWGVAFMTVQVVVAKFTVAILSWLVEVTQALSLAEVTLVMVCVGLLMFLLPPVPGVPIYLALGIATVATGRDTLGIVGSMAYCAAVSLVLKLTACALQQKLIGEWLSKYVSIRQLVGVNSTVTRSMKVVLSRPGLNVPKVAILVGGPDWPTGVLCGIMHLGLLQILVGTLPIIFLIVPTMLTGTFAYMASVKLPDGIPEFPWAGTVGAICAAVTAIVQFGSMLVAAYYLERASSSSARELESMPYDEEVRLADAKAIDEMTKYREITQWNLMPTWAKVVLILSVGMMVTCCYVVQLFSDRCFVDYELTYTVSEHLEGNLWNLVRPLGWAALGLFVASCCLLSVFTTWATIKGHKMSKVGDLSPSPQL